MRAFETLTAREFWQAEMPDALELLLDPDAALADDTKQARRLAEEMRWPVKGQALPFAVWAAYYRD